MAFFGNRENPLFFYAYQTCPYIKGNRFYYPRREEVCCLDEILSRPMSGALDARWLAHGHAGVIWSPTTNFSNLRGTLNMQELSLSLPPSHWFLSSIVSTSNSCCHHTIIKVRLRYDFFHCFLCRHIWWPCFRNSVMSRSSVPTCLLFLWCMKWVFQKLLVLFFLAKNWTLT